MKRILEFDFIVLLVVLLAALSVVPKILQKSTKEVEIRPIIVALEVSDTRSFSKVLVEETTSLSVETTIEEPLYRIVCYDEEPEEVFAEIDEEFLCAAPTVEMTEADFVIEETTTPVEIPEYETTFERDSIEVIVLAKCLCGEAGDLKSTTEKAAVIWCVLNRVDSEERYYPDDIVGVVTQKYQFTGYKESHPVKEHLVDIVMDVLGRWQAEHRGEENVGRVLPKDYLWFYGLTARNTFRNAYEKDKAEYWDWSLPNPYED